MSSIAECLYRFRGAMTFMMIVLPSVMPLSVWAESFEVAGEGLDVPGRFLPVNNAVPTHLGSIDGPLAGPGIWGQFLAGETSDSLVPVDIPREHREGGFIGGASIYLPNLYCGTIAQVQLVAWDGTIWGTAFENVPANQLGKTDIAPVRLSCYLYPDFGPAFTQPAIVPPIPEPSAMVVIALSFGFLVVRKFRRRSAKAGGREVPSPRSSMA